MKLAKKENYINKSIVLFCFYTCFKNTRLRVRRFETSERKKGATQNQIGVNPKVGQKKLIFILLYFEFGILTDSFLI